MSKLTNEQLVLLMGINDLSEEGLNTSIGVSTSQIKNFSKAKKGKDSAPAYMLKFCSEFVPQATGEINSTPSKPMKGDRFIITSAQNNTKVHVDFFNSLLKYCDSTGAKLLIGKFVYNKNGFQNGTFEDEEIYYDSNLDPYLVDDLYALFPDLYFCANVNILPTAKFPLSGFENYQSNSSIILPTSKLALESVATAKGDNVKFIYGTGTVTLKNYIQKKAGQLAEDSHTYSALVVEWSDTCDSWFVRQIEADVDGSFYDLDKIFTPEDYYNNQDIEGITLGDIHAEKIDHDQMQIATDIINEFNIDTVFVHDLHDFTTRNHHNRKSGHFLHEMGTNTVLKDLYKAGSILDKLTDQSNCNVFIVRSNHDDALESWLDDPTYSYRTDPQNAELFLELQLEKYRSITDNQDRFILLEFALNDIVGLAYPQQVNFLDIDQSFIFNGIECGVHGHIGTNGSRGNPKQFIKLNKPMNTGHTHTASIFGNIYTSGVTGSLEQGYNKGASSWSHSHTVIYKNGKRSILSVKNGQYKA